MMWGWFLSIIDPEKDRGITRRPADWHLLFDRFYFGARRLTPKHSRRRLRSLPHGLNPYFFSIGDQGRSFDKKMMLDKFVFSYAKTWFGGQTAGFWELTSVWRFSAWFRIWLDKRSFEKTAFLDKETRWRVRDWWKKLRYTRFLAIFHILFI